MVELTKLNGDKMILNEAWIESVEALPDTTITFNSGNKVVVLEKMDTLLEEMLRWQIGLRGGKQPLGRLWPRAGQSGKGDRLRKR